MRTIRLIAVLLIAGCDAAAMSDRQERAQLADAGDNGAASEVKKPGAAAPCPSCKADAGGCDPTTGQGCRDADANAAERPLGPDAGGVAGGSGRDAGGSPQPADPGKEARGEPADEPIDDPPDDPPDHPVDDPPDHPVDDPPDHPVDGPPADPDADNDGVLNTNDRCASGETGWTASLATDADGDGCRDAGEDGDDDNDSCGDPSDPAAAIASADADRDGYGDDCTCVERVLATVDFEHDPPSWSFAGDDVWHVVTPIFAGEYGGARCAVTSQQGGQPQGVASRLILPEMRLPARCGQQELQLRFSAAYGYESGDGGHVELQLWDEATAGWSAWQPIGQHAAHGTSEWSRIAVDLTPFAGERARISLLHETDTDNWVGQGWSVDDFELRLFTPAFDGSFDSGWGDWSTDFGVWQHSRPNSDRVHCRTNGYCMATHSYANGAKTHLSSPTITLPTVAPGEEVHLRFHNTYNYDSGALGSVELKVWDDATGWSGWISLGQRAMEGTSPWSRSSVELTRYAGRRVQVGFLHRSSVSSGREGWIVDELALEVAVPAQDGSFESGWGDWYADGGVWQQGSVVNSDARNCPGGSRCIGTMLLERHESPYVIQYPYLVDSRLVSPTYRLPVLQPSEQLQFRFNHWFAYASGDFGEVQISVWHEPSATWSAWTPIGGRYQGQASGWSAANVDLRPYAGKAVRIGLLHSADGDPYLATGWYVDDCAVVRF